MNKYLRGIIHIPCGILKFGINKLLHGSHFHGSIVCAASPLSEITIDRCGSLTYGRKFRIRDGAKIRVRDGGNCIIGNNVSVNSNDMIACHDSVLIGDNVQLGPNVQIYDHDHDFRVEGGIGAMKFCTSPVVIGNDCWLGANTVILRGTELGNGCVVGAGCVLKGRYPAGSVIIQKRETMVKQV